MAKRKAAVNDIIFELDNEDIEISSDEEVKEPKKHCIEIVNNTSSTTTFPKTDEDGCGVILIDEGNNVSPLTTLQNGGKTSIEIVNNNDDKHEVDSVKKTSTDNCKATILNEDIVVDSPGNSDLGVEGCENRKPLITVRFCNKKLAANFKQQVKEFLLNLIKIEEGDIASSDNETDLELDIWPEDLKSGVPEVVEEVENNLFFVDTDPGDDRSDDIPRYRQTSTVICNKPAKEPTPPPARRGPTCFNCDGSHSLKDCPRPRDFARIASKRKSLPAKLGRYHVEDDQKFGHLIPGRLSGQMRHALGLKRHELPLHIYRMRLLGYPPGWLEEARISHSGISMFDSSGNAILEADDEEGEVMEPGSKDKFDIKKILDFPGFNVPPSPRYKEEAHKMNLPPMGDQDSKLAMLQFLAPNAMKAYKRKKLTMFPSAGSNNVTLEGQAEMELDSGDELAQFPSVPPLPDEAPPPNPPPPPPLPSSPPPLPPTSPPPEQTSPSLPPSTPEEKEQKKKDNTITEDDLEVIEVLKVGDIPIPMADFIVIDEDDSEADKTENSDRVSPTLDDLEAKKKLLLDALEVSDITLDKTETESYITLDETTDFPSNDTIEHVDSIKGIERVVDDSADTDKAITDIDIDIANCDNVDESLTVENVSEKDTNVDMVTDNDEKPEMVIKEDSPESSTSQIMDIQESTSIAHIIDTQKCTSEPGSLGTQESSPDADDSRPTSELLDSQASTSTCQPVNMQEPISMSQGMETQETANLEFNDTLGTSTSGLNESQQSISNSQLMKSPDSPSIFQLVDIQESSFNSQDNDVQKTSILQEKAKQQDSVISMSQMKNSPSSTTGHVRDTEYGTPVLNIASSYVKLPSDDKFAKDICDVINFENLPNSTGKYKKISALLKKVKSKVDRIQES